MRKLLLILPIMILGFSCSDSLSQDNDSSSVDNSLMTFEVTTLNNQAFDEYSNNHTNSFYPITITLTDYDPGSEPSGTVNLNISGSQSISGKCSRNNDCFVVHLDSSFFPVEFLVYTNLKIDNSKMSGQFQIAGSTIDTISFEFIASRKE